jgi:hypothetical protein
MRKLVIALVALGWLGVFGGAALAADGEYRLEFIPTQNAPPGASAVMSLKLVNGETIIHFRVRGLYPDTVYTIWTVFNPLDEPFPGATRADMIAFYAPMTGHTVPSSSANKRPGFPPEGNGVSPTARLGSGFTSGMGMDPGASFVTNRNGDGEIRVKLDFDVVNAAPVSSKDIIVQCVPGPVGADGKCSAPSRLMRVTSTWLRRYIGQFPLAERAARCANYDPIYDPESAAYDLEASNGMNAALWQCIDPATVQRRDGGLPLVYRYAFDHFRLANHPDDLTHGFIGGSGEDHWIDMVGRRVDLVPLGGPRR